MLGQMAQASADDGGLEDEEKDETEPPPSPSGRKRKKKKKRGSLTAAAAGIPPDLLAALRAACPGQSVAQIGQMLAGGGGTAPAAAAARRSAGPGARGAPITPPASGRRNRSGRAAGVTVLAPGETPASALRPRRIGGAGGGEVPSPARAAARGPPPSPLAAALARGARNQDEDAEILHDFRHQKEKPEVAAYARCRDWVARATSIVAAAAMSGTCAYVRLLHALTQWNGRAGDEHDGKFLAAVGDRSGMVDPPWVEVDETYFGWEEHYLPKDRSNNSAIAQFFRRPENRGRFFDASGEEKEDAATWVPIYPLLPLKVAKKAAENAMTPWEIFLELDQFGNERSGDAQSALTHGKTGHSWPRARERRRARA